MTSTMEGKQKLARLKLQRAATFERLAREWSNPAHLSFVGAVRRRQRVAEFHRQAKALRDEAEAVEGYCHPG